MDILVLALCFSVSGIMGFGIASAFRFLKLIEYWSGNSEFGSGNKCVYNARAKSLVCCLVRDVYGRAVLRSFCTLDLGMLV
jgi:hypothetical protein